MKSQTLEAAEKRSLDFYIKFGDYVETDFAVYDRREYKTVFEG